MPHPTYSSAPDGISQAAVFAFRSSRHWLGLFVMSLPGLLAGAESGGWQIEKQLEQFPISPSIEVIEIDNALGDIRIRRGPSGQIELQAIAQHDAASAQRPKWTVRSDQHRWRLTVSSNDRKASKARADLFLQVPADLRLRLSTRQGRIDVRHQQAAVQASSDSGTIMVTSTVALKLRSRSGAIIAAVRNHAPTTQSSLRSQTGAIDLILSADAPWQLKVRACAGIDGIASVSERACRAARVNADGAPLLSVRTAGRFSLTRMAKPP